MLFISKVCELFMEFYRVWNSCRLLATKDKINFFWLYENRTKEQEDRVDSFLGVSF